jgi:four helix bundle protein
LPYGILRVWTPCREVWQPKTIGRQLLWSRASVESKYRAACRGRSRSESISRLAVTEEEADETPCWLDFAEFRLGRAERLRELLKGADEVTAVFAASRKTAEKRMDG